MAENRYQANLIKRLKKLFPSAVILKNDAGYMQGIPDLLILLKDKWAMLEVKASKDAPTGPNQEHYVKQLSDMSYAAFIYPENEDEVLIELQSALRSRGKARVSKS